MNNFQGQGVHTPSSAAGGGVPSRATVGTGITSSSLGGMMGPGHRRATLSLSDLRTPLVENIMSMLPMGHDKALKYAFYNVLALILTAVCIVAFWAGYCILSPFIVPLLWALLCGSVIHPFKDQLVTFAKDWILMVKSSTTPLSLQLVYIPFRAVDKVSESIGSRVAYYWKGIVVGSLGFFFVYLIYHNPPLSVALFLYWVSVVMFNAFLWIVSWINGQVVLAATIPYLLTIIHYVFGVGAAAVSQQGPEGHQHPKEGSKSNNEEKVKPEEQVDQTDVPQPQSSEQKETQTDAHPPKKQDWEKTMLRTLAMTSWLLWFIYLCGFLPYPLLLLVMVSLAIGSVVFIRKYSLRRPVHQFTAYSTIRSLLSGVVAKSAPGSRGLSRKGSLLQIRSRRNTQITKTPSPAAAAAIPFTPRRSSLSDSIIEYQNVARPAELTTSSKKTNLELKIPQEHQEDNESSYPPTFQCELPDHTTGAEEDEVDGILDSNKFLYGVFCACLVVQVWNRLWLIHLLPIPVIYYGVKRACISFGFDEYLQKHFYEPIQSFYMCAGHNSKNVFPQPVRNFFDILAEADKKILSVFESYLDMVATIIILVAVVVVSVIFLIFVATQFYAEGDHLVRVGANVINSTVSQYPEISKLLPEGWESFTGSLVGKAYHYGRDYIKTMIRDSVAEKNPEKGEEMEKQVIELWDRIYINWNRTWDQMDNVGGKNPPEGVGWDDIVKTGQNWFDTNMIVTYAKANYGQLLAVLESLWTVLIGNVSLAISAITSVFSVLFGGGSAILNLIINFVVFFTALFYLLSSSTSVYKPVEIFNTWLPGEGKHSSNFVFAIEESVSGVFSATMKMSAFYGMWTWLIHTLFQVNIVFVPSFFAAIFAAVPLLMPYWAVFPAVLELWLIQGQWTKALFMLLAQMAPMSLVDAQIYSEIKGGGHPYLTALAVAGGIFYFGFQGAIVGPVVLCFLFVAAKVGSSYMKEETLDD